jgi:hypothetical protein
MRDSLTGLHAEAERLYEDTRHSHRGLAKRIRVVRDGLADGLQKLSALLGGHRLERPLQAGDEVYVVRLHKWGTVERVDRQSQRVRVRIGEAQVEVAEEDVQPWGGNV